MINKMIEKVKAVITKEEVMEIIKDFIKIPSYPGINEQETKVALYIKDLFQRENIEAEIIPVVNGRCNVIAKLKGKGKGRTLLLTGHTDTVPPYDMKNPFDIKIEDDKLFGRGAVDMKGPLACMIAAMIGLKRADINLKGDVVFAGVIDEEHKSEGTIALIESGISADAAIVGEPSDLNICLAHRGLEWFEFHFKGKAVHGGKQKEGINAILKASNFIQKVEESIMSKLDEKKHSLIGPASMNYGTINGGTQPSTVAGDCILTMDRRWLPGQNYCDIVDEYNDIIKDLSCEDEEFNCTLKVMDVSVMREGFIHEAMEIDKNHPIIDIVIKSTQRILNTTPQKTYFPAWSDGGLLCSYADIPTIIFAPGDLQTAHSAEEFIDMTQIYPATLIYSSIAIDFCS